MEFAIDNITHSKEKDKVIELPYLKIQYKSGEILNFSI